MSSTNFKKQLQIRDIFVAEGTIEREYEAAWMYAGVVQVTEAVNNGETTFELDAGAYGMGKPKLEDSSTDPGERNWTLQLHRDSDPDKREFKPNQEAYGFVVVQLEGGGLTGWIDKLMLTSSTAD